MKPPLSDPHYAFKKGNALARVYQVDIGIWYLWDISPKRSKIDLQFKCLLAIAIMENEEIRPDSFNSNRFVQIKKNEIKNNKAMEERTLVIYLGLLLWNLYKIRNLLCNSYNDGMETKWRTFCIRKKCETHTQIQYFLHEKVCLGGRFRISGWEKKN